MPTVFDPFRFLLIAVAGWMNQHQLQIIEYRAKSTGCYVNKSANGSCGSATRFHCEIW